MFRTVCCEPKYLINKTRYKGTYCSQEVAIKVLKTERVNTDMQSEFAQEVYIMR